MNHKFEEILVSDFDFQNKVFVIAAEFDVKIGKMRKKNIKLITIHGYHGTLERPFQSFKIQFFSLIRHPPNPT